MNFCPFCGKQLDTALQFCPYCGSVLTAKQTSCSAADDATQEKTSSHTAIQAKEKAHAPKKLLLVLLILAVAGIFAAILLTKPFGGNFTENPEAIQKATASIVKIYMYDINNIPVGTGSGFAAFDKDIIITNYHCIEDDVYTIEAQREDGSFFSIDSVIAYHEGMDIAVLRAPDCGLTPLKTANGLDTKRGEKVAAIGSPDGIASMYSTGVISKIEDKESYSVILSTASISPGSSGGALFNDRGEVIAITSAFFANANEIYISVPIEYAKELYDNRTPEEEMTLAEFYAQSEHPYSVDHVSAYGNLLHNQTIFTYGYISGIDTDIYLVSSPDLVLYADTRDSFDLNEAMLLRELRSASYAIQIDTERNHIQTDYLQPGDIIIIDGTVMYYGPSDIRVIASDLVKVE